MTEKRKPRKELVKASDLIKSPLVIQEEGVVDLDKLGEDREFNAANEPQEGDEILFLNGQGIGSRGNIVCVTGPAKSRKTVVTSSFVSSMFCAEGFLGVTADLDPEDNVLHVDTEQGYLHYYNSVVRMFRDAGVEKNKIPKNFKSYHTRDLDTEEQIKLIEHLLEKLNPRVVVLDGVADLIEDINEQKEAKRVANMVLRWSTMYNAVIICVIHNTVGSNKMTGAIGTALTKKCETSIKVEKDENNEKISNVSCQASRNRPFNPYSIIYSDLSHRYEIIDHVPSSGGQIIKLPDQYSDDQHREILTQIFEATSLSRTIVNDKITTKIIAATKEKLGIKIGRNTGRKWQDFYLRSGYILQDADTNWIRIDSEVKKNASKDSGPTIFDKDNNKTDDLPF